ncbi:MAG: hypothetical protein F7B59_02145 [Desulfurococcales archaeon]|nr:hypothetical protein [Desulfurococcales archaeon]
MDNPRILLLGFGNVGRTLTRILLENTSARNYIYLGACDSKGCSYNPRGFRREEIRELLEVPRGGLVETVYGAREDPGRLIEESYPNIVVDARPSNYGEPHKDIYELLNKGSYHIVTANKAPLARNPELIVDNPLRNRLHYRATFMAGTPLFDVITYGLLGRPVVKVRGVFNTTTTFMLTLASQGYSFDEALGKAISEGIAEPDPPLDVECIDPAAKASIIAATLGYKVPLERVNRRGLRDSWVNEGFIRCVSTVQVNKEVKVTAFPTILEPGDPLRLAVGKRNVATVDVSDGNSILLSGSGGGPYQTAMTLLSDMEKAKSQLW